MKWLATRLLVGIIATSVCTLRAVPAQGVTLAHILVNENGDTIPHVQLPPIYCFAPPKFKSKSAERRYYRIYNRMARNLVKVYPYAVLAQEKLAEMDSAFMLISDKRERKQYINKMEKEMFREFEAPLRKLTYSQGRMLIKLVDRQTGRTGYQIVKELKGGFSAFFWQSIAVLFKSSLKAEYDPEKDENDKMLERLIFLYENGQLIVN